MLKPDQVMLGAPGSLISSLIQDQEGSPQFASRVTVQEQRAVAIH